MVLNKQFFLFIVFIVCFCSSCIKTGVNSSPASSSGILFYGNRYGNTLRSFEGTSDGGYLFGGYTSTSTSGGELGFIQKCDRTGKVEWYETYGFLLTNKFNVVHATSDGGYIAAGTSTSILGYAYLVKTDRNGVLIWQKTFGGNYGNNFYDVKETPDHGFVAVGLSYAIAENPILIVKTDANGNSLWTRQIIQKNHNSLGTSVAFGPNGEIAVGGYAQNWTNNIGYPTFTYLSPNGSLIIPQQTDTVFGPMPWPLNGNTWLYGSSNFEKIIGRPNGFIFIMSSDLQGLANNPPCLNCGISLSVTVFKIDFNGNILWKNSFPGLSNGITFNDAQNNPNGGVLISGGTIDASGTNYCWLLNTDANGRKIGESLIPVKGFSAMAAGAIIKGNNFDVGINLMPLQQNREGYFGFLTSDQNGKIIDNNK